MFTAAILGTTLLVAAPALKANSKDSGIVGEWVVERQETGGGVLPFGGVIRFVFTADGKWAWFTEGSPKVPDLKYSVDLKARPHAIDLDSYLGVFKVEGDVLTLCYSYKHDTRPKQLAVGDEEPYSLYVMKRAK
jgi:uncharacterized protein (TIGR03067 family)